MSIRFRYLREAGPEKMEFQTKQTYSSLMKTSIMLQIDLFPFTTMAQPFASPTNQMLHMLEVYEMQL